MPVVFPPSTRRLLHQGVELAASGLDQRLHPAEPLPHPRLVHGLLESPLPGGEALHLHLSDDGEERPRDIGQDAERSEEHTSELQSLTNLVCRLLLEKKKKKKI